MAHRINIRPRQMDHAKPLQMVKDIKNVRNTENQAEREELINIEQEINRVLSLYDKKKSIITPKSINIEKNKKDNPNNKNLPNKFENSTTYNISEFHRPQGYIIYSEETRKKNHERDYEATRHDVNFLQFEGNFMKLEELETVISKLENDIGTGEQIPPERAKNLIIGLFPDKADHADKLTKFFFTRREDFKKSLLRKFWKEQKSTDKYISTTFRRRERDKMRTRRNKQNELESLEKLIEIKDITEKILVPLLNGMKQREEIKQHIISINNLAFKAEVAQLTNGKIPPEIEESWHKEQNEINKIQYVTFDKKNPVDLIDSPGMRPGKENIYPNNVQDIKKIPSRRFDRKQIKPPRDQSQINTKNKSTTSESEKKKSPSSSSEKRGEQVILSRERIHQSRVKEKIKKEESCLKLRLRRNRIGKIVIDRYIQKQNSFNPFDDAITEDIAAFNSFGKDYTCPIDEEVGFKHLYENFVHSYLEDFFFFSDSDEESTNLEGELKKFQNEHKMFLKNKRGHPQA